MATDGVNVVVADYAKEAAEKVAAEIRDNKGDAIAVKVDVGDPESVAEMMRQAIAKYGQIDYAFCGAGIMDRIPVIDMPEEVWDRLMRINLKGVFLCAQAAARHMMPRKEGRLLQYRFRPRGRRRAALRPLCGVESRRNRFHQIARG